jgi:two-component system NtrC family sensor kinase
MKSADKPAEEIQRLEALRRYHVLDTEAEAEFDELTRLAAYICNTPISLLSLVDESRQWFKSRVGLAVQETARELAFCAHAIHSQEVFEVRNTLLDERFADNPLVTGDPAIRFYAGIPLLTPDGFKLGTLCVIDQKPRQLAPEQLVAMQTLARQVMTHLELRLQLRELKVAQTRLTHSEKLASLGHLTAGIVHEINNPMNFVQAGVVNISRSLEELYQVLEAYDALESSQLPLTAEQWQNLHQFKKDLYYAENKQGLVQTLHSIQTGVSSTLEIVKGVHHFSRPSKGTPQRVNIHQGLETTLLMLTVLLRNLPEVHITRQFALSEPEIEGYAGELNQVFMNLLVNAIQALEGAGNILVTTIDTTEYVMVSITDTGSGMSQEVQKRLFEPFYTTKTEGEGTGLGLSIAYDIIQKHGGQIHVSSEVGKGSCFTIQLNRSKGRK